MTSHVEPADFRSAMARFPGGVTIVTTRADGERRGLTATAVCSATADPPSVLVCLNRKTGTCVAAAETGRLNINLLSGETGVAIAKRFAGEGGTTGEDKFSLGDWYDDHRGVPVLGESVLTLCGEIYEHMNIGTHLVFACRIVAIIPREGDALVYERSQFHRLAPLLLEAQEC